MKCEARSQKGEGECCSHFNLLTSILKQKRLHSTNREMKAIRRIRAKTVRAAGLILLFAEKRPDTLGADERNQTGILTSASNLTPAFPLASVALGICSRYSGATVPDSHRVPRHLTAIVGGNFSAGFKERFLSTPNKNFPSKNFRGQINKESRNSGIIFSCLPDFLIQLCSALARNRAWKLYSSL